MYVCSMYCTTAGTQPTPNFCIFLKLFLDSIQMSNIVFVWPNNVVNIKLCNLLQPYRQNFQWGIIFYVAENGWVMMSKPLLLPPVRASPLYKLPRSALAIACSSPYRATSSLRWFHKGNYNWTEWSDLIPPHAYLACLSFCWFFLLSSYK